MPLQDLTPQLRTRLNRTERSVGWFVLLATLLLLGGFGYYLYQSAETKGWFAIKARYYTLARNGTGLAIGDPVTLNGFNVGKITDIQPTKPREWDWDQGYHVFVEFEVLRNNYGYIWVGESRARFVDSGFLGKRQLDLSPGTNGYATYILYHVRQMNLQEVESSPEKDKLRLGQQIDTVSNYSSMMYEPPIPATNILLRAWQPFSTTNIEILNRRNITKVWVIDRGETNHTLTAMWNDKERHYEPITGKTKPYGLPPDEPPQLTDRMQAMVAQIQAALPGILQLTNQIGAVLTNVTHLTSNLNEVVANARPVVTNLNDITANLRNPEGSLGEWIIPTNLNQRLDTTLVSANGTLSNLDTNLATLNLTLGNLANITSNLNNQVQANTNILTNISDIVVHTDQFIQGLKRFWLFKHLFAAHPAKTEKPQGKSEPLLSPKQKGQ